MNTLLGGALVAGGVALGAWILGSRQMSRDELSGLVQDAITEQFENQDYEIAEGEET